MKKSVKIISVAAIVAALIPVIIGVIAVLAPDAFNFTRVYRKSPFDEIELPPYADNEQIGIFKLADEDLEKPDINGEKPLIVFFPDYGNDNECRGDYVYYNEAGYDALIFMWNGLGFKTRGEAEAAVNSDDKTKSVPYIFCSEFSSVGFIKGDVREIRFIGEGLGALIAAEAFNMLIQYEEYDSVVLPDRLTCINPEFEDISRFVSAAAAVSERGGAIENIVTEYETDAKTIECIREYSITLSFGINTSGGLTARQWYEKSALYGLFTDYAINDSGEYSPSFNLPTPYLLSRKGVQFYMDGNDTAELSDDRLSSLEVEAPIVAGIAFYDNNLNGIADDGCTARAGKVKIELYIKNGAENKLLGSAMTNDSGIYRLNVPKIYANRADELFVKAALIGNKKFTVISEDLITGNGIYNETGLSADFTFNHRKNVKIINVGVVRI